VQMGALAGVWIGQRFGLSDVPLQTVVARARRQAFAAAFRSPAGEFLLALEVFGARIQSGPDSHFSGAGIAFSHSRRYLDDAIRSSFPRRRKRFHCQGCC